MALSSAQANPLTAENQKLLRDNDRLTKAEIVIDVQKM
jgi:hypothetical protein